MTEKEYFENIKKEHIIKALDRILEEGYNPKRKSSTYDLVYKGFAFPPKYVASLASYFASAFYIPHNHFKGGEDSACFSFLREKGFSIKPKSETKDFKEPVTEKNVHLKYMNKKIEKDLDLFKFRKYFEEYISYCKRSQWLKYREAYKFRFARWVYDNIDIDNQSNEEILELCRKSQEQEYDEGIKGVNFIVINKRFNDHFIELIDVENIQKMHKGELLDDTDLKESSLSFPKFSIWVATLLPKTYKVYGNEDLIKPLFYLFDLDKKPKSGVRGFNLATTCLNKISQLALEEYESDLLELIQLIFPETSKIKDVDLVWLVQDFMLFMNQRVLDHEPNYYWVNQGDNYKVELENGIVAAPDHSVHHHKRLKELYEEDIIIHYTNSAIRAVSKVTKEFEFKSRPYESNGEIDLVVKVNYQELETPIPFTSVHDVFEGKKDLLPKKYGPFTKNLKVGQMYMCIFTKEAYSLLFSDYNPTFANNESNTFNDPFDFKNTTNMNSLNKILYGPPGTGKTYQTKNEALKIIGINPDGLEGHQIKKEFDHYVEEGRIIFTTFHQSMSYEDFIEGIKPVIDSEEDKEEDQEREQVSYKIVNGIFKEACENAKVLKEFEETDEDQYHLQSDLFKDRKIFKVSLGNTLEDTGELVYDFCKENNYIAIGWGGDLDFSGVKNRKEIQDRLVKSGMNVKPTDFNISAIERLAVWMRKGDLVFVSHGNKTLKAVGVITGDYEYKSSDKTPLTGYNHFRKVEWKILDAKIPVKKVYEKNFSQQSIYELYTKKLKTKFFGKAKKQVPENNNYVIIIDEINRGNVSQIFGELITLIEEDKREGKEEALKVTLPYSKKEFSVPQNLYIIGTMNTADRSIEALDSALRRRFEFKEMLPDYELIDTILENKTFEGYPLSQILRTINERITVLIDRDHQIGHSYFLKLKDSADLAKDLEALFMKNIIPLLQEYFFNDYVKIAMVIGEGFMDKERYSNVKFAANEGDYESDYNDALNYEISKQVDFVQAIKKLMNNRDV